VVEAEGMGEKAFSYESEKVYYGQRWPQEAKPYLHLEPYLRCWLDPEAVFGGKRVLDIGAGECTYTRLIAEKFGPREIVACELFCERMLPAVRANRSPNLRFVAGDAFRLPFQDESFDIVFGSFVLCQLPDLDEIISEVRRVLLDNGHYIGIEPNPYHPIHLYRYIRGNHSPNQYLFGPQHLSAFRKAGFEVTIRYFYAKLPRILSRFLGTCMGIVAEKRQA
jgi:ubiquinone/menaquinone biosynthesis C-methylase UbiE